MREDEERVGKVYRSNFWPWITACIPVFAVAWLGDIKWVVAVATLTVMGGIVALETRLYDLCIRLARTNRLLFEAAPEMTDQERAYHE